MRGPVFDYINILQKDFLINIIIFTILLWFLKYIQFIIILLINFNKFYEYTNY